MANPTETPKRPLKIGYAVHIDEKYDREPWIPVCALWETANGNMLTQTQKPAFIPLMSSGQFKLIYQDPKPAKANQ